MAFVVEQGVGGFGQGVISPGRYNRPGASGQDLKSGFVFLGVRRFSKGL